jgi:hypothetical protein
MLKTAGVFPAQLRGKAPSCCVKGQDRNAARPQGSVQTTQFLLSAAPSQLLIPTEYKAISPQGASHETTVLKLLFLIEIAYS